MFRCLNASDDATGITPIQVSIEIEDMQCIKELIIRGVRLNMADKDGRNNFHYAARASNETIIQVSALFLFSSSPVQIISS